MKTKKSRCVAPAENDPNIGLKTSNFTPKSQKQGKKDSKKKKTTKKKKKEALL